MPYVRTDDEEGLGDVKQDEESAARQLDIDIEAVMALPSGRRLLWRLLDDFAGAFGPSYTGDALGGAFREGQRAVGLHLMRELQRVGPAAYVTMVQERLAEAAEKQARAKARALAQAH